MFSLRKDDEYGYLYDTEDPFDDLSHANVIHASIVDGNDIAQLQNEDNASMRLIAILSKKNNTIGLLRNRASKCKASEALFSALTSQEYRSFNG
jgi:hypothetical protein